MDVLWVKGSGGNLRTSTTADFASLYQHKLLDLQRLYAVAGARGPKTPAEDRMVSLYPHCTFNLNPRAASIDTPLHAFVPFKHVDHTHPNSVIAVAASRRSEELTAEIFDGEVGWIPWIQPGFELGLELERVCRANPHLKGVILAQHGLINWAHESKACYELTLSLIEKAAAYIQSKDKGEQAFGGPRYQALPEEERQVCLFEILPWLRGQLSQSRRAITTVDSGSEVLRFVNSHDSPRLAVLGTSCPDHFLRTKI